jgi:hypothetical protein
MTLQIVTRDPDAFAQELVKSDGSGAQGQVVVMDITGDRVDYDALVNAIFAATEIQVL